MASALFTPDQEDIIRKNPIAEFVDLHRNRLLKDGFDHIDEGT